MHGITSFYNLFCYFVIYSFLGWSAEVIFALFKSRGFVNRGFLNGPICPIYGVGVLAIYLIIEWTTHAFSTTGEISLFTIFVIFIITTVASTVLEAITGAILYKIFGTRWWDYSKRPLNYKGYICLEFSIIWGLLGTSILVLFHTKIIELIDLIPKNIGEPIIFVLGAILLIDGTLTVRSLIDFKKLLVELETLQQEYVKSKDRLINSMKQATVDLSLRIKNELEQKPEDLKNKLKQIQKNLKTLQSSKNVKENSLKTSLIDFIDKDRILSLRTKFELEEIHRGYEKRLNKLSSTRLFRVFPSMKLFHYNKSLKDLKKNQNDSNNKK